MSQTRVPDIVIFSTLSFKISQFVSQIQETSLPSAILSFNNTNRLSLPCSARTLKTSLAPVGFLIKKINTDWSWICINSNLPKADVYFSIDDLIVLASILYNTEVLEAASML